MDNVEIKHSGIKHRVLNWIPKDVVDVIRRLKSENTSFVTRVTVVYTQSGLLTRVDFKFIAYY